MAEQKIWTAALVVIGDEILSGRTADRNVAAVATWLNRQGIRLAEVRIVPDDEACFCQFDGPSEEAVAEEAKAAGARALWLQLGIVSPEARAIAEGADMEYVEDACTAIVHRNLG